MNFKEWWVKNVRPYVERGSELEQTILPWVEDAWKAGQRSVTSQPAVEPDVEKRAG